MSPKTTPQKYQTRTSAVTIRRPSEVLSQIGDLLREQINDFVRCIRSDQYFLRDWQYASEEKSEGRSYLHIDVRLKDRALEDTIILRVSFVVELGEAE